MRTVPGPMFARFWATSSSAGWWLPRDNGPGVGYVRPGERKDLHAGCESKQGRPRGFAGTGAVRRAPAGGRGSGRRDGGGLRRNGPRVVTSEENASQEREPYEPPRVEDVEAAGGTAEASAGITASTF